MAPSQRCASWAGETSPWRSVSSKTATEASAGASGGSCPAPEGDTASNRSGRGWTGSASAAWACAPASARSNQASNTTGA